MKKIFSDMAARGIRYQLILLILVPTLITAVLLGVYFTRIRMHDLSNDLKFQGMQISEQMTYQVRADMLEHKSRHALSHSLTRALGMFSSLSTVAIYDSNGQLLTYAGIKPVYQTNKMITAKMLIPPGGKTQVIENEDYFYFITTISKVTKRIMTNNSTNSQKPQLNVEGYILLSVSTSDTIQSKYEEMITTIVITLIGLLISVLIGLRISSQFANPLLKIIAAVEDIRQGKFNTKVSTTASGELKTLGMGINSMAESLNSTHEKTQQDITKATLQLTKTMITLEAKNKELDQARKDALVACKAKAAFLTNVSHEIRTPMNSIIGFTTLLLKTKLNNTQYDYLTTIQSSAENLLKIINDILDFSKIEAGKLSLSIGEMIVQDLIEDVEVMLSPNAHEKGLYLTHFIYDNVPTSIWADSLKLRQVLINLINNAIKFTITGGVAIKVMMLDDPQTTLKVEVIDSGEGLSLNDRNNLFKAFNQGDSTTSQHSGTGLGLAISKKLIEEMQGKIDVDSLKGQGSTFWFTIPVDKMQDYPYKIIPGLNQLSALIYETLPLSRLNLLQVLEHQHLNITCVNNQKSLLQTIKGNPKPFDIILLSTNTLDKSEHFKNSELKPIAKLTKTPILVITNQRLTKHIKTNGIKYYIARPFREKRLLQTMCKMLNITPKDPPSPESAPESDLKLDMKLKVLAVDDNKDNLKLIDIYLKELGVNVTTVDSGRKAIDYIKQQTCHLILMDMQMPEIDGLATTKVIRDITLARGHYIPIIALTADVFGQKRKLATEAGLDDYCTKPITQIQLHALLKKWSRTSNQPQKKIMPPPNNFKTDGINDNKPAPLLNLAQGIKIVGEKNLAIDMLKRLQAILPDEKLIIEHAFKLNDKEKLSRASHKLHGAALYCGVPALQESLKNLSKGLAIEKNTALPALIENVLEVITNTEKTISTYLTKIAAKS